LIPDDSQPELRDKPTAHADASKSWTNCRDRLVSRSRKSIDPNNTAQRQAQNGMVLCFSVAAANLSAAGVRPVCSGSTSRGCRLWNHPWAFAILWSGHGRTGLLMFCPETVRWILARLFPRREPIPYKYLSTVSTTAVILPFDWPPSIFRRQMMTRGRVWTA